MHVRDPHCARRRQTLTWKGYDNKMTVLDNNADETVAGGEPEWVPLGSDEAQITAYFTPREDIPDYSRTSLWGWIESRFGISTLLARISASIDSTQPWGDVKSGVSWDLLSAAA